MKDYGQIPGGKNELQPLLYPFHHSYPFKLWSKFRWWKNTRLIHSIQKLNSKGNWLTVVNRLGARGDTLITANVIRCIKKKYSNLKINCITPYPELIEHDPEINSVNQPETFYSFDSSYFELIVRNEQNENVVEHNLLRLGIKEYEYKSYFHLLPSESNWARRQISELSKPLIAVSTRSKEEVKNWHVDNWKRTINELSKTFSIIHLGDNQEPKFQGVHRFAGKCTMRESASLLSHCSIFVGPDSLLMHIANGLNIKSIIIFGSARPVNCLGYSENINLIGNDAKNGSWIHHSSIDKEMYRSFIDIEADVVVSEALSFLCHA